MKNLHAAYIKVVMYRKISLAFHFPVRCAFVIKKGYSVSVFETILE